MPRGAMLALSFPTCSPRFPTCSPRRAGCLSALMPRGSPPARSQARTPAGRKVAIRLQSSAIMILLFGFFGFTWDGGHAITDALGATPAAPRHGR